MRAYDRLTSYWERPRCCARTRLAWEKALDAISVEPKAMAGLSCNLAAELPTTTAGVCACISLFMSSLPVRCAVPGDEVYFCKSSDSSSLSCVF